MAPVMYQARYSAGVQPSPPPSASDPAASAYHNSPRAHTKWYGWRRLRNRSSNTPAKPTASTLVTAGSNTFRCKAANYRPHQAMGPTGRYLKGSMGSLPDSVAAGAVLLVRLGERQYG